MRGERIKITVYQHIIVVVTIDAGRPRGDGECHRPEAIRGIGVGWRYEGPRETIALSHPCGWRGQPSFQTLWPESLNPSHHRRSDSLHLSRNLLGWTRQATPARPASIAYAPLPLPAATTVRVRLALDSEVLAPRARHSQRWRRRICAC